MTRESVCYIGGADKETQNHTRPKIGQQSRRQTKRDLYELWEQSLSHTLHTSFKLLLIYKVQRQQRSSAKGKKVWKTTSIVGVSSQAKMQHICRYKLLNMQVLSQCFELMVGQNKIAEDFSSGHGKLSFFHYFYRENNYPIFEKKTQHINQELQESKFAPTLKNWRQYCIVFINHLLLFQRQPISELTEMLDICL